MRPQVIAIKEVIKNYRFHAVSLHADGFKNDAKIMKDEANRAEAELAELIRLIERDEAEKAASKRTAKRKQEGG